jgi:hypothetical protein
MVKKIIIYYIITMRNFENEIILSFLFTKQLTYEMICNNRYFNNIQKKIIQKGIKKHLKYKTLGKNGDYYFLLEEGLCVLEDDKYYNARIIGDCLRKCMYYRKEKAKDKVKIELMLEENNKPKIQEKVKKEKRLYRCHYCGRDFKSKSGWKRHEEVLCKEKY